MKRVLKANVAFSLTVEPSIDKRDIVKTIEQALYAIWEKYSEDGGCSDITLEDETN